METAPSLLPSFETTRATSSREFLRMTPVFVARAAQVSGHACSAGALRRCASCALRPRIFQNVHAGAPTVDQINAAVLVGADVVRLDRLLAVRGFRHVTA